MMAAMILIYWGGGGRVRAEGGRDWSCLGCDEQEAQRSQPQHLAYEEESNRKMRWWKLLKSFRHGMSRHSCAYCGGCDDDIYVVPPKKEDSLICMWIRTCVLIPFVL